MAIKKYVQNAAADVETFAHKVLSNLRHDGTFYHKGKTVQLSAKDAAPLIAKNVVEPIK